MTQSKHDSDHQLWADVTVERARDDQWGRASFTWRGFSCRNSSIASLLPRDYRSPTHDSRTVNFADAAAIVFTNTAFFPARNSGIALEERLSQVQSPDAKIPIIHRLEVGDPASEILRVAEEIKCDLIVLGTHGRGAVARLLMGNVAEHVVRKANCAVLVVKSPLSKSSAP